MPTKGEGNYEIARGEFAYALKGASASSWTAAGGVAASCAVIALMLYRATAYREGAEGLALSDMGWLVLVAGIACLVLSVAMLAYSRHLAGRKAVVEEIPFKGPDDSESPPAEPSRGTMAARLAVLQLKEDERKLYDMIADRGGEVLQRDLVASGEFSKAKVTRLLDKLEGRELIKRERHGMTNLVKLVR